MDLYISSDDIEVLIVNDLKYDASDPCCYICDEIDAMLDELALIVAKNESIEDAEEPSYWVYGLASVYHSQGQVFFFSATYDAYHKKLLRQVFGIEPAKICDCKS